MLDNLNKYQIILASNSPRRKELMSGLGVDYVVRTLPDVDESYPDTLVGAEIPEYIARDIAGSGYSSLHIQGKGRCLPYHDEAGRIIDYGRYHSLVRWESAWKTGG